MEDILLARKKNSRWSYAEVLQAIEGIGNGTELLSTDFKNSNTNLSFRCGCGRKFEAKWTSFVHSNKKTCNYCGRTKWSIDKISSYLKTKKGKGCKLISTEYKNSSEELLLQCICGNEFHSSWNAFTSGNKRMCSSCSGVTRWNTEKVKEYLETSNGNGCELIGEYVNIKTKVKLRCKCGRVFSVRFDAVTGGRRQNRCAVCSGASKEPVIINWNIAKIHKYIRDNNNIEAKLISTKYTNRLELMNFQCSCGEYFKTNWSNFLRGSVQCEKCNDLSSKGELSIKSTLERLHANFNREYSFSDCKYKMPLRFDFVILNNDKSIKGLVEYDGEQHFRPVNFGGMSNCVAQEALEESIKRDYAKNQYCQEEKIPLLRIPYWDFDNIESLVKTFLLQLN